MHHGARKKRKLSSPAASAEKKNVDDPVVSKRLAAAEQQRENERILLSRASVIKEKYRRLVPAYDSPWKEPNNVSHWDHLLSEAAWMWNDIAQERLWKKAVAKQLALEAVQYWEKRYSNHSSSSSSSEVVVLPQVFGIPFGRQLKTTLQDMARKRHRKKTIRYEKTLRKFQREYEVEELAAIYGFNAEEGFGLLNIKVPTQPCVAAPNEVEKDVYMLSPPKPVPSRRTPRPKSRPQALQEMQDSEEMVGNGGALLSHPTSQPKSNRKHRPHPQTAVSEMAGPRPPRNGGRHQGDWNSARVVPGSDISISQPELEPKQKTPTINDFLAKNEDRLLFFASNELQENWQIVSDVMASAGIYMSPEACCERLKSIENNITQEQSHLLRPRAQGGTSAQGFSEDILLKQLRIEAKDVLRKSIPENMAAKLTPLTCSVHKKRCLRMKAAMNEGNIGSPSYHISQCKLSEGIMKSVPGRMMSPKDSWKMAHNRNMAGRMIDFRKLQVEAATIAAAHRNIMRPAGSQPPVNGATSLDAQQQQQQAKYQAAQQPSSMQPVDSWSDVTPGWGLPTGIPANPAAAGFSNSGSSIGGPSGVAPPMQAPWNPPSNVLKGLPQWPNVMGSASGQGQPSMEASTMMPPLRTGLNFVASQQHVMGPPQVPPPQEQPMQARPQPGGRPPQPQMPLSYAQSQHQLTQIFRRCQKNPDRLKQFLHSPECSPTVRQLIVKAMNDPGRMMPRGVNAPPMGAHPAQMPPQRMGQLAPTQQGMPPSASSRVPGGVASSSDPYSSGNPVPGLSQGNFATPPGLEHPSQYNSRVTAPLPGEFSDPQQAHGMRSRPQRPSFPPAGYDLGAGQLDPFAMNPEMQQSGSTGAMFGAMPVRMHGVGPEMLNPVAPSQMELRPGLQGDGRHPLHGVPPPDPTAAQMLDPSYPLVGSDDNPPDGNFSNDAHSMNTRPSMSHYSRNAPGHFGK